MTTLTLKEERKERVRKKKLEVQEKIVIKHTRN